MAELTHSTDWPWQHWANLQPDAIALITDSAQYTWSALNQRIHQLAAYFSLQGLQANQTVALCGKNSIELLLSQLAIMACSSRVLLLNPRLPDQLLEELLPHLNVDFILDFTEQKIVSTTHIHLDYKDYQSFDIQTGFQFASFDSVMNRPATLILTSGSTGLPKAAVHSIAAHLNSADGVVSVMNFQQEDCWALSLPLFHVSGQGIMWRWLLRGGRLAFHSGSLVEILRGSTHASLVPTQLWRLLNDENYSGTRLKAVLLGGATIPTALTDLATRRGIACWSGYGMTEMASTVCAKRANGKNGVGIPLKGKLIRIVNDEIQIQSSSQALGYWFDGKIISLSSDGGWFKTNDKGEFIDGEYQIIGRLDNLFISGGENIQPEDIETVLNSHPNVSQSFIIPIDDKEFGQRPVAVIELKEQIGLDKGDEFDVQSEFDMIGDWLKDKLAPYQYPNGFYLLAPELKASGIKISRQQVKHWLIQQI